MEELNSGPPKTNPSSGREKDLNPGPPDYKSSALPLGHARLPGNKVNKVKNPNWRMADLLAVYKLSREVELGATENNIR